MIKKTIQILFLLSISFAFAQKNKTKSTIDTITVDFIKSKGLINTYLKNSKLSILTIRKLGESLGCTFVGKDIVLDEWDLFCPYQYFR